MKTLSTYNSTTFSARNQYIKDAQWVCHTINSNLLNYSKQIISQLGSFRNKADFINGEKLIHVVCIFNKDRSQFNGTVNNSTIIIDNWAGKTDFAKNMYPHYKNLFKNHFYISKNSPIEFEQSEKLNLSPQQIQELTKKYPDFIFKNTKRKFMNN